MSILDELGMAAQGPAPMLEEPSIPESGDRPTAMSVINRVIAESTAPKSPEQVFPTSEIVMGELPKWEAHVQITDTAQRLGDMHDILRDFESRKTICQKDIEMANEVFEDAKVTSDSLPIAYFTKQASRTHYQEAITAVNHVLQEKAAFLDESFSQFLMALKASTTEQAQELGKSMELLDHVGKLLSTELSAANVFIPNPYRFNNSKKVAELIGVPANQIKIEYFSLDESLQAAWNEVFHAFHSCKYFNKFYGLYHAREIVEVNFVDIESVKVDEKVQPSLLSLYQFIAKATLPLTSLIRKLLEIDNAKITELVASYAQLGTDIVKKVQFADQSKAAIQKIETDLTVIYGLVPEMYHVAALAQTVTAMISRKIASYKK